MTKEYKEGWKDFLNKGRCKCPYPTGSKESKRWWAGWYDCNSDPARLSENSALFA